MMVRSSFFRNLEFSVIGIEFTFHRSEVQGFEIKGNVAPFGPLGKALARGSSDDGYKVALWIVRKEVFQSDTEHQSNAQ